MKRNRGKETPEAGNLADGKYSVLLGQQQQPRWLEAQVNSPPQHRRQVRRLRT